MNDAAAFAEISGALIARTGHHYYEDKERLLRERLRQRVGALNLASLDAYRAVLKGETRHDAEAEWRQLEDLITIGETYFFRYADHFEALRTTILPDLINRRAHDKALRIWSIGCANGAEPYSIAILIRELLSESFDQWRVSITGGDISERALEAARKAHYGQWALRTLSDTEKGRYFDQIDPRHWALKREYKYVRFERQNLLELLSPAPPLAWTGFDLILCRNVLIYFSPERAIALTRALKARLNEGGALLLGHAEATLELDPSLSLPLASEFGQTLQPLAPQPWMPAPLPDAPRIMSPPAPPPLTTLSTIGDDGLAEVRAAADSGDYLRAHDLSKALIARQPLSAEAYYYDALISLVADGTDDAEAALRRALYLDRSFALAHHRLALVLLSRARKDEARRAFKAAMELARHMPADAPMPEGDGVTAGAFAEAVARQLEHLGAAA